MADAAQAALGRAVAARRRQAMGEALAAAEEAMSLAPRDPAVLAAHAQIRFEAGLSAAGHFAKACAAAPADPALSRNHALALIAEGQRDAGLALFEQVMAANPLWLDGHRTLAGLRATAGEADFARGYAEAVAAHPEILALRMAWFHALCTARRWDEARCVLDGAEAVHGVQRASRLARAYLASESGERADDPALFDPLEGETDVGLDLARVRHFLRGGQIERARDRCLAHRGTAPMRVFWPYLSLAWRLLDDPGAQWLDRGMDFVRAFDSGLGMGELAELAVTLRSLHTMEQPWHEQSVRGGTQTERPLLLRLDPVIARVREAIEVAVAAYRDGLPDREPGHPLLDAPRGTFLFAGSWSVRLRGSGFHASHTHPQGWVSSAFYVTVPEPSEAGEVPAGHLQFGTPPPELGLSLAPYGSIAPEPGRLVLFPSTMWHGTVPFAGGERMTIAFDVVPV